MKADTRQRLLDATYDCLNEQGYSGTTTSLIARRAGVSQGALFSHFGSKDELMVSAVLELMARSSDAFTAELTRVVRSSPRPEAMLIDLVWGAMQTRSARAYRQLLAAAASSESMRAAINEVEPDYRARQVALSATLFPRLAERPEFPAFVSLVLATLHGLTSSLEALGPPAEARLLETKAVLVRAMELLHADTAGSIRRPGA